jgi:hypothetical protein
LLFPKTLGCSDTGTPKIGKVLTTPKRLSVGVSDLNKEADFGCSDFGSLNRPPGGRFDLNKEAG